jgi:hypothetical protein
MAIVTNRGKSQIRTTSNCIKMNTKCNYMHVNNINMTWLPSSTIIPQDHIWHHNPTWPKCPPIISVNVCSHCAPYQCYNIYVGNSTCMQTCTTPLHIFVFSLTAFLAVCLCVQSKMQYYKRAIYFFNNKSKVKPSLQTDLSKASSTPQYPLHNSNVTTIITLLKVLIHNVLNKPIFTKL